MFSPQLADNFKSLSTTLSEDSQLTVMNTALTVTQHCLEFNPIFLVYLFFLFYTFFSLQIPSTPPLPSLTLHWSSCLLFIEKIKANQKKKPFPHSQMSNLFPFVSVSSRPSLCTCIYLTCCHYEWSIPPTGQPLHFLPLVHWRISSYLALGNLALSPRSPSSLFTYKYTLVFSSLKCPPLTTQPDPICALAAIVSISSPYIHSSNHSRCSLDLTPPRRLLMSRLPVTFTLLNLSCGFCVTMFPSHTVPLPSLLDL